MKARIEFYSDNKERQKEKEASRAKDREMLASGEISARELFNKNSLFPAPDRSRKKEGEVVADFF